MIDSKSDIELEDRIEQYINGQLSAAEVDELWAELVESEYYLDYLKSMANLKEVANKQQEDKKMRRIRKRWSYVAAVIIILLVGVVGVMQYTSSSYGDAIKPVDNIELSYYRSDNGMISNNQKSKIIRNALSLVNQGKEAQAKSLLKKQLKQAQAAKWVAKLNLNLGSISYNEQDYKLAIDYYDHVINHANDLDVLTLEKAYWYTGNAYFQLNELKKAKANIQKAYELNGAYRRVAKRYLDALSKRLD